MNFEEYKESLRDREARQLLLDKKGRPFHVLLSQQWNKKSIEKLCKTATSIRRLDRHEKGKSFLRSILSGHRIMNLFSQPSTRTAESFIAAAEKLGASARLVTNLQTSSFAKGETVEDSVRTLSSFFDAIVIRHHDTNFATRAAWSLYNSKREIPVISAGCGKSQHVTQSLLDMYTLQYSFSERGGIDNKTIAIVGDISRNRTARSLAYLLTKFENMQIIFVSPNQYRPNEDLVQYLNYHDLNYSLYKSIESMLKDHGKNLDAIYMTRSQNEWNEEGMSKNIGSNDEFILHYEYRNFIKENCIIMHPLPRVNELPCEWDKHENTVIWRQVRNGFWVRAAIFSTIFGADDEITNRAQRLCLL